MQKRGRTWWMMYRNLAGVKVQENSGTDNPMLARAMLTERALLIAETRVAKLRAIFDEASEAADRDLGTEAGVQTGHDPKRPAGDRILSNRAPIVRTGKKAKNNGGKR